jgi:hypothetical protein
MNSEQNFDKIIKQKIEVNEEDFRFDEQAWHRANKMIEAERGINPFSLTILKTTAVLCFLGIAGFFVTHQVLNIKTNAHAIPEVENKHKAPLEAVIFSDKGSGANTVLKNTSAVKENWNLPDSDYSDALRYSDKTTESGYENKMSSRISSSEINAEAKTDVKSRKTSIAHNHSKNVRTSNASMKTDRGINKKILHAYASYKDVDMSENTQTIFWLEGTHTALPVNGLDSGLRKTAYDFIRVYNDDYYKFKRPKTHYLSVEGGMAYLLGWDAPKGKDAKGFNLYGGLNYGIYLGKKSSLSSGLQFYNISNIEQPFFSGSHVSYDFGANGTYTVISGRSLFYAAVPLTFHYSVTGKDRLSGGLNTGILCAGLNTEENFVMQDGLKVNSQVRRNFGIYEGMNPFNVMLTAAYSRTVSKRVKMNAEFVYGLSDIFKSKRFNTTRENIPGIRLGVHYMLSDR